MKISSFIDEMDKIELYVINSKDDCLTLLFFNQIPHKIFLLTQMNFAIISPYFFEYKYIYICHGDRKKEIE